MIPPSLGKLKLEKYLSGEKAKEFINQMHESGNVAGDENEIGFYSLDTLSATLYISKFKNPTTAREKFYDMLIKIIHQNTPFIYHGQIDIEGRKIALAFGMGQAHYIYNEGDRLIWLSADFSIALETLHSLLKQKKLKNMQPITQTNIPGAKLLKRGKVRDIYEINGNLLIVATDRISAFDVVLPNPIPYKGYVLTQISIFWFKFLKETIKSHLVSADINEFPDVFKRNYEQVIYRSMLVKKAKPLPVECIVRGYISGSAWKEYKTSRSVCGIKLPDGLNESDKLDEPIFTPSTKAETGHDENISFEKVVDLIGRELAEKIRDLSLEIYTKAEKYARERGIIIADTKFEFGIDENGELILIDEVLTPDSSRFWPLSEYKPGRPQPSFDKQYVRDYLESLNWDKTPPAPELPEEVIKKTSEKYLEAYKFLTGEDLLKKLNL
jgi:phosphoribosylaminoimidazole-succinocarboxamide synthase